MAIEQLRFVLAGDRAEAAADQLAAVLAVPAADVRRSASDRLPESARKVVDLIALATLVLTVPPAILAATDLVDRVAKRRKAHDVINAAKRAQAEMQVEVMLIGRDGALHAVASLDPDELLEAASPPSLPNA